MEEGGVEPIDGTGRKRCLVKSRRGGGFGSDVQRALKAPAMTLTGQKDLYLTLWSCLSWAPPR